MDQRFKCKCKSITVLEEVEQIPWCREDSCITQRPEEKKTLIDLFIIKYNKKPFYVQTKWQEYHKQSQKENWESIFVTQKALICTIYKTS